MLRAPLPPNQVAAVWSQVSDGNMSERYGPLDEVLQHRTKFLAGLDLRLDDCVRLAVTVDPGSRIREVGRELAGRTMQGGDPDFYCDAYITSEPGLALWLLIADCVPIMFYDPKTPRIALAHCGFASTNARLAAKTVERLAQLGSNPADLQVGLGPGIKAESYIFDHEHMKPTGPEWEPYLSHPDAKHTAIDLFGYNTAQIASAGVPQANIHVSDIDVFASPDFYSHVQTWRTGAAEGRFAAVLALKK
jgi:copper oxidase (laccase) domain-containing protein